MGLGGYLTWTAAAKSIAASEPEANMKFLPVEYRGGSMWVVQNEIFDHSRDFVYDRGVDAKIVPLVLNDPRSNYCKNDTPHKATQRGDAHIIEQICEVYGVKAILKCHLDFRDGEVDHVKKLLANVPRPFVTIEPHSKTSYTPNRSYDFSKWQSIVDELSKKVCVVQVGKKDVCLLDNVIDMTGKTTFVETAIVIGESALFLSTEGGLVHAASTTNTPALVVMTGYQTRKMVEYPQNITVDISSHGPCGLKVSCPDCVRDVNRHDWREILNIAENFLESKRSSRL